MTVGKSLVEDTARAMCRRHANKDGVWFDDAALNKHIDNHSWEFKGYAKDALSVLKDRLPADDRELVERLRKLLPVSWDNETDGHGEPTRAVLTFGEHQTQAITMCPDDWMVLNELPDRIIAYSARACAHEQQTGDGVWSHACLDCGHDFLKAKKAKEQP